MDGYVTGAHNVLVTRVAADQWEVVSQPAPNNRVFCMRDSSTFPMNVRFTVRSSTPLSLQ